MLRRLAASLCVLLVSAVVANAGVMGVATLVANPPGTLYTTDLDYNAGVLANTWVSYALGVKTDDGSKISAFDVALTGQFNQRWTFSEDTGTFVPTPGSANISNGDSHLIPGAVVAVAPSENNNTASIYPTAADTGTRDYGVGTTLAGAWGYDPAGQAAQVAGQPVNFAYIVIPRGVEPTLQLTVKGASNPTQPGGNFNLSGLDFFGTPPGVAPNIQKINLGEVEGSAGIIMAMLDDGPADPAATWSNLVPTMGTPALAATLGADGKFSWNPAGSLAGHKGSGNVMYSWTATASNGVGNGDTDVAIMLTLIPEPATLSLVGLAMIGFLGLARRRS